jgi:hypothetical protein
VGMWRDPWELSPRAEIAVVVIGWVVLVAIMAAILWLTFTANALPASH